MDWEYIAPMIAFIVLIVTVGGVMILRPLASRLAELIELMARDGQPPGLQEELVRMRELMENVGSRLETLEERQDFTDRLLSGRTSAATEGQDRAD